MSKNIKELKELTKPAYSSLPADTHVSFLVSAVLNQYWQCMN